MAVVLAALGVFVYLRFADRARPRDQRGPAFARAGDRRALVRARRLGPRRAREPADRARRELRPGARPGGRVVDAHAGAQASAPLLDAGELRRARGGQLSSSATASGPWTGRRACLRRRSTTRGRRAGRRRRRLARRPRRGARQPRAAAADRRPGRAAARLAGRLRRRRRRRCARSRRCAAAPRRSRRDEPGERLPGAAAPTTRSRGSARRSTRCSTGSRPRSSASARFVADAGHELRTPLAMLQDRARAGAALRRRRREELRGGDRLGDRGGRAPDRSSPRTCCDRALGRGRAAAASSSAIDVGRCSTASREPVRARAPRRGGRS